jgi:hypothetical protein
VQDIAILKKALSLLHPNHTLPYFWHNIPSHILVSPNFLETAQG